MIKIPSETPLAIGPQVAQSASITSLGDDESAMLSSEEAGHVGAANRFGVAE